MNNLSELLSEALEVDVSQINLDLEYKKHEKWDSLAALSLITAIEDEFGMVLSDSILQKLDTVQKLSDYVLANKKNK